MSDCLWPHDLQHASLPCPSLSPRVCSNLSLIELRLSWRCHPPISFCVTPFSSCPQYFPASGCFPMGQLFTSGDQSIGASASASVLPMISFRFDWLNLLAVQGTLKSLLQYYSSKASILLCSAFFMVQLSHPYMTTGKIIIWLDGPLWAK